MMPPASSLQTLAQGPRKPCAQLTNTDTINDSTYVSSYAITSIKPQEKGKTHFNKATTIIHIVEIRQHKIIQIA